MYEKGDYSEPKQEPKLEEKVQLDDPLAENAGDKEPEEPKVK